MFIKLKFKILNFLVIVASYIFGDRLPPIPSVSAIIQKGQKILMIKLSYKDGLALPGGFLKINEDFETAIKREIKEETGLMTTSLKYFGTYFVIDPYAKVNVTYKAKVKGVLRSSEEGVPLWIEQDKIVKKLAYKYNLKAIKEFLKK